jgi:voltage-gated potassium channel
MLLAALVLSIPAFYLVLTGPTDLVRNVGHGIYAFEAVLLALVFFDRRIDATLVADDCKSSLDMPIFFGAIASIWPTDLPWSSAEWILRMSYCGIVFIRLVALSAKFVVPNRLLQICTLAVLMLAIAGAGFLWLEPRVHSYGDGVWLAFTTGATVGYGDLVPSTPASRVFAAFIVLLGYALFSLVTANIAALLVGGDEKRLSREMHADLRALRKEIDALRIELRGVLSASHGHITDDAGKN